MNRNTVWDKEQLSCYENGRHLCWPNGYLFATFLPAIIRVIAQNESEELYSSMEYTYFENSFLAIMRTSLAF
jgi:hypothetical protein